MIILTAGHTGPNTGAQCAETHFDEGAENIWLRNRIAEILTNKYGLVVLMDDDKASMKLLTKALSEDLSSTKNISHTELTENTEDAVAAPAILSPTDDTDNSDINSSFSSMRSLAAQEVALQIDTDFTPSECLSLTDDGLQSTDLTPPPYRHLPYKQGRNYESAQHLKILPLFIGGVPEGGGGSTIDDFVIDLHFNAHGNPQARGTEAIVANDATTLELRFASRLAHTTSDALDIPLRCIKSESQTPHRRLGMLHLTPQSVILEVCFCTSPEDVEAYRKNREKLAADLAWAIYELL